MRLKTLLLARHAQATTGPGHRVCASDPLTEVGRRQAGDLTDHLAGLAEAPDRIVASTAVRARETAATCARRLGLAVHVDHRLCDHGSLSGRPLPYTLAQQAADLPMDDVWHPGDATWDGETAAEFWQRTSSAARDIVTASDRPLVVSHLGTVSAMLRWAYGVPPDLPDAVLVAVPNASITELRFRIDRHGRTRVTLMRAADDSFLSERTEG